MNAESIAKRVGLPSRRSDTFARSPRFVEDLMISAGNVMTDPTASELEKLVSSRLNGRVRGFQLIVESQGLVLRGRCSTYYAKQLAQHTVMEVTSIAILANEIEVVDVAGGATA